MINISNTVAFAADTKVWDVIHNLAFEDYGRLLFPVNKTIYMDMTLKDVGSILSWYSHSTDTH